MARTKPLGEKGTNGSGTSSAISASSNVQVPSKQNAVRNSGVASEPMISTKAKPKVSTRERILKESARLFAETSYAATTITQIETAVGLSPGSGALYRHFASKHEILIAVFEDAYVRLEANRAAADAAAGATVSTPDDAALMAQMELAYKFVLLGAESIRDVNMLYLKEGANLGEDIVATMRTWTSEAFERTALAMQSRRAVSTPTQPKPNNSASGLDAEDPFDSVAEAFVFLSPILYARLVDWLSGSLPAGLSHERISKAWAKQQVRLRGEDGDRTGLT